MTATDRWLVLHADDYGMNGAVNAGILHAFRDGLLTSTSLLANAPAAEAACTAWPQLAEDVRAGAIASADRRRALNDALDPFDLGIHLNLTQGRPLSNSYPAELLNERGQFPGIGAVFRRLRTTGSRFRPGVLVELQLQIERMLDHHLQPTHLNGHQYLELLPGVAELIPELTRKYAIPVIRVAREPVLTRTVLRSGRLVAFGVALIKRYYAGRFRRLPEICPLKAPTSFFGTAHAGLVNRNTLNRFLQFSSPCGCTEIGLHPAIGADVEARPATDEWHDPLAAIRPGELNWLSDAGSVELIASHGQRLGRLSQI
ncbi:MAG: ChbG/HpnK family deacetylase [Planctomycetes bacterium]|nr:ChbG/HpnK family deacetylase [Planctomycetota bacterium]